MTDIIKYNTIPVYIAEKYEQPITEKQLKFKIPIQAICWNDFDGKKDNCLLCNIFLVSKNFKRIPFEDKYYNILASIYSTGNFGYFQHYAIVESIKYYTRNAKR